MKVMEDIRTRLDTALEVGYPGEYTKTVLDAFADQLDNEMQAMLVAEVIERYADLHKELEEKSRQLRESDAIRREAQEIALLGNWELDLSSHRFHWSDTMERVLELSDTAENAMQGHLRHIHPDDRHAMEEVVEKLLRGEATPECQYRLVMEDGRVKWVHARCAISPEPNGGGRAYGTIQDITNAKVVEEILWKYNNHLEELVHEKVAEASASQMTTIYALVKLAESRDDDTGEHITRTARYCRFLAERLYEMGEYPGEIDSEFIEAVSQASPLHDIGKVGIPDSILLKPGRLTPEEFEVMKKHVTIGYSTLASVKEKGAAGAFLKLGMEITRFHHEKWDGTGYPQGLKGVDIPISARIMALADVYDALRSKRIYKRAYPHEESVELITRSRGYHFDPLLVDIFLDHHQVFRDIFEDSTS